ncbi:hypothetical protein LZD49_10075 [Dyadobacter sp. CY261]|uniref:hypothetical protein n=1 Tax=Dyadobacter sp. CY261 TaxID=2907203 RepID=UPI001F3248AA|nr:hypothetical protein [Dyadobacter sp. CY261]MCF0070819.1 hypothetical protein [Dyadobacter sp. CY261]
MKKKIVEYFRKILRIRSGKARKVTFLIIGTVGCGKTALIYFIYEYLLREIQDAPKPMPFDEDKKSKVTNNNIKEIELRNFVAEIQKETDKSGDFLGTETGSISSIVHQMNGVLIQIYNISGEIFKDVDTNKELVDALYDHLENSVVSDTYCLLCKSFKNDEDIAQEGVDFFSLHASLKRGAKAKQIFDNIKNGINTLRIVTKFDGYSESGRIVRETNPQRNHSFHRIAKILFALNKLNVVKERHDQEFIIPTTSDPFPISVGYEKIELNKYFTCTGLYSRIKPDEEIFEIGQFQGKERNILKEQYRGKNLTNLGMYGVDEIINFSIKNKSYFKKLRPKTNSDAISLSHYKFILGL